MLIVHVSLYFEVKMEIEKFTHEGGFANEIIKMICFYCFGESSARIQNGSQRLNQ